MDRSKRTLKDYAQDRRPASALRTGTTQHTEQTFGVVGLTPTAQLYNELQRVRLHSPPTWSIKNSAPPLWPTPSAAPPPQGQVVGAMLITADAIISQGIAEAFIAGVPMLLIIAGGRTG